MLSVLSNLYASARPMTLRQLAILSWVVFVAFLGLPIAATLTASIQSGHFLEGERDFVYFYSMGRMLNRYPPASLYDYGLQKKVANEVRPLAGREYSPNPYPPFVAALFRPFARMSFRSAYLLWQSISFALYITGLVLLCNQFFPDDRARRSLAYCFALAFLPFLWIMVGGQIPTVGFLGMALAFHEENKGRPYLSGLGLSMCLYKPTLLVLFVPMLLVTRRYKILSGFISGAIALISVAIANGGIRIWLGYFRLLLSFGTAAVRTHGYRELKFYMDLSSFSSLLPGGRSWAGGGMLAACALFAMLALVRAWRKAAWNVLGESNLLWAATVTWTLVLNVYVPIYDSIIAVIGVIATTAVLRDFPVQLLRRQFRWAWLLIFGASWITIELTDATGLQILTVLFALLGTIQLIALRRMAGLRRMAEDQTGRFAVLT